MAEKIKSINRVLARELTPEELGEVSGGSGYYTLTRMAVTQIEGTYQADPVMDYVNNDQYA